MDLSLTRFKLIWPVQLVIRTESRNPRQANHKLGRRADRLDDLRGMNEICYLGKGGTVKLTKKKRLRLILGQPNQLFGAMRLRLFRLLYWAKLGQYT